VTVDPALPQDPKWIDELSDEQCMEIFWLYVESPDEFLNSHPAPLLGAAMRYALRHVLADVQAAAPKPGGIAGGAARG
jgi:hypothetical protein